jgi:hypothetical protein
LERCTELLGVLVDAHDRARCVIKSGDCLLELPVQDPTISDHDHLVEDRLIIVAVES